MIGLVQIIYDRLFHINEWELHAASVVQLSFFIMYMVLYIYIQYIMYILHYVYGPSQICEMVKSGHLRKQ